MSLYQCDAWESTGKKRLIRGVVKKRPHRLFYAKSIRKGAPLNIYSIRP